MPIVSIFFGIVIRIYHGDHNPPHFHAAYGEFEAIIDIATGKTLAGRLPPQAKKLVEDWRMERIEEVRAAWANAAAYKTVKRIRGIE